MPSTDLNDLFNKIMRARQRVYRLAKPTPLERVSAPDGGEFFLKREDLSPIHSYKWRGAFNKMGALSDVERLRGVVAASAGNHAQGVALSARKLDCQATLFMPRSTPKMKIREVERHGGERVEIVIEGDTYDDASALAKEYAAKESARIIPPYDDWQVMAGQGTIGDEIVMAAIAPEVIFLQIGGGGMAGATACALKAFYPDARVIGVEAEGQASMSRAIAAGAPVDLGEVDVFCDGTAVRRAGELTWRVCSEFIDEFMTVSNNEVCAAIQLLWESARVIAEPSGAIGVAGLMKRPEFADRRRVAILSGANMDFVRLAWVARHAGIGLAERRYFQFEIDEQSGSLVDLLETVLEGVNIIDFQYGKVDEARAWPVIGFEASPEQLALLDRRLADAGIAHKDVTTREDVDFRIIHYRSRLFKDPHFAIIEFPERAGALHEFMRAAGERASICYFNYTTTGEQIGRAMMGFEFSDGKARESFIDFLDESGPTHRELSPDVLSAIL